VTLRIQWYGHVLLHSDDRIWEHKNVDAGYEITGESKNMVKRQSDGRYTEYGKTDKETRTNYYGSREKSKNISLYSEDVSWEIHKQ
jgi:hypothetical protein